MPSLQSTTHTTQSVSMVALLPLILIPIVISGFLLVYALVGGVLEGDSLQRWLNEAWSVALPTGLIQLACCAGITVFTRYKRLPWNHLINWMSALNALLAVILVALVYYWSH